MHSCSAAHSFLYTGNDGKDKYVSNASYPSARREVNTQFIENHTEHCCRQHADHPRIFIPPSCSSYFGSCLHRQPKSRPPSSQSPARSPPCLAKEVVQKLPTLYLLVCRVNIPHAASWDQSLSLVDPSTNQKTTPRSLLDM